MSNLTLTPRAYMKLILHSAKYQSRSVIGLLVAPASSASSASASSSTLVTDVLPLFHTSPLAPMLEVCLTQVETLMTTTSQQIIGVYFSAESYESRTAHNTNGEVNVLPTPQANVAIKIAEKIRENGKGNVARIVLLDAVRLGAIGAPDSTETTDSALDLFESSSSSSSSSSKSSASSFTNHGAVRIGTSAASSDKSSSTSTSSSLESARSFSLAQLRSLLQSDKQRLMYDFDDHLDDVKADWTNVKFEKEVLPTM